MMPTVSIILPTYNCPQFVGQAIECMLAQTYADFELIVVDDGSTDNTPGIARQFADPRMRVITQANRGLAGALNRGLELSSGRYIARQDQDDVSFPERLAKQVAYLDAHPACALVGTWAQIWRENEDTGRHHAHPSDNARLKFELLMDNPFVHSSVMMRKAALDRVGGYCTDRGRQPPEDFELWSRIAREYEVSNLPEVLHAYREVPGSMSRVGPTPFVDHLVTISAENIAWAADTTPSHPDVLNIAALAHRAAHRLKGEPDFRAMRHILRRAAIRATGVSGPQFVREASRRIDVLHYRFWEMRHGHGWRRHLFGMVRGAARFARGLR